MDGMGMGMGMGMHEQVSSRKRFHGCGSSFAL